MSNSVFLFMINFATFIIAIVIAVLLSVIAFLLYSINKELKEEETQTAEVNVIPINLDDEYEEFNP